MKTSNASTLSNCTKVLETHWKPQEPFKLDDSVTPGWSGMAAFRVIQGADSYHLKIPPPGKPLEDVQGVRHEIETATFAGERGLAPRVVWSDAEQQALMTDFLQDASKSFATRRRFNPVIRANVQALAGLHQTENDHGGKWRLPPFTRRRQELLGWVDKASQVDKPSPLSPTSLGAYAETLSDMVDTLPFPEAFLHGDMNGCNTIFTPEKVWFIDWGSSRIGDSMDELANYALHVNCTMENMPKLWRIYARAAGTTLSNRQLPGHPDFERLQLNVALGHARSYAMHAVGMPWHKPENRDADLAKLVTLIQEDAACLGLESPALKA